MQIDVRFTTDKLNYIIAYHQGRTQCCRFSVLSPGNPLNVDVVAYRAARSSE
jgi:hypothetical protein